MDNLRSITAVPRPDGLVLAPFRALRYAEDRLDLAAVTAPPYDVISAVERSRLAAREPHNVVRLTLPEDDSAGSGYAAAARALAEWREQGILRPDTEPAVYVYEQRTPEHTQRGIVGALGLTPPEDGIVLPHENTMVGPVADRLALLAATAADLEMIFLVYDGGGAASRLVAEADQRLPVIDITDAEGVRHRVWAVTDAAALAEVAADLHGRRAVIADGHHRYTTFRRYQEQRHDAGDGAGPWDFGLALLVDASRFGPAVEAIHRSVPSLPAAAAAELARTGFQVTETDPDTASAQLGARAGPRFVLTDGRRAWLLSNPDPEQLDAALPVDRSPAWRRLDVAIAHSFLISGLWRLTDNEDVVEFHHDAASAVAAAAEHGGVALLLNPTPVADVAAVAAAGDRMPRKSTLFLPKPATGLLIRSFADA